MKAEDLETEDIELKIEFGLHESCMQGRDGYYSGIRPNHWIPGRDYTFLGQVEFDDRELLKPGEKCKATLKGIVAIQDKKSFKSGFSWHVCEANKIMGYAKVL
jgi:hypothetical protein